MKNWLNFFFGITASLLMMSVGGRAFSDELAMGEKVFKRYCLACHALPSQKTNHVGPNLHGVVGRAVGQVPDFSYSSANTASHFIWTEENLNSYLVDPRIFVLGTKMIFPGIKSAIERKALIAFLKAN
ncbi:MAG: cytochrome c family protein [Rhodospirillaceae bacterium]